jgi:hypothetical protein
LADALKSIDGVIYGGVSSRNTADSLNILRDIADQSYRQKRIELIQKVIKDDSLITKPCLIFSLSLLAQIYPFKKYRVGQIDGSKTPTLKSFYQAIEKALSFPNDFEYTFESLDQFLNDLDGLNHPNVALYITQAEGFLARKACKSD